MRLIHYLPCYETAGSGSQNQPSDSLESSEESDDSHMSAI